MESILTFFKKLIDMILSWFSSEPDIPEPIIPVTNPVIDGQIPRLSSGWGGGVGYYKGLIIETAASGEGGSAGLFFRDPAQGGTIVKTVTGPWDSGYHGVAYDTKRDVLWLTCWGANTVAINPNGGPILKTITGLSPHKYGIYYNAKTDRLWIALHVDNMIAEVDPETGAILQIIKVECDLPRVDYNTYPCGIAWVNNRLWITLEGEENKAGWLMEIDINGKPVGPRLQMPETQWANCLGGITTDGGNGLWVKGGKKTAIWHISFK